MSDSPWLKPPTAAKSRALQNKTCTQPSRSRFDTFDVLRRSQTMRSNSPLGKRAERNQGRGRISGALCELKLTKNSQMDVANGRRERPREAKSRKHSLQEWARVTHLISEQGPRAF